MIAPIRVWAPHAQSLSVVCSTELTAMTRASNGWWEGPALAHGADYAFMVDGQGPYPDPRSAWQPDGVHKPSRVFDASRHAWTDAAWRGKDIRGAVIYELHVGTFTPGGTLDDAIDRLAHLASLGIDVVELMPLAPFPGNRGWGYDGVSLFGVHEAYGGPAALQRFVDAAHSHGIAVCLDVVYNHLGPDGNYLSKFGPYFTDAHHTPWGWAVNLDGQNSSGMRQFIIDNALRWLSDFHIDALRLDAIHALIDNSETHVLAELSNAVAALSRERGVPLSLIAESDLNDDIVVRSTSNGGLGMTAQWADDVHHALHAYLTGERHGYYVDFGSVETLDKALRHVFVHDGTWSTFRQKHWGAPLSAGVSRDQFVVFASNHDQIGNRALGDRPSVSLSRGAQAAGLAVILLGPFTPQLFMGEEIGSKSPFQFFTDHAEPLGAAVTQGRTHEFAGHGWEQIYGGDVEVPDPQALATFERSRVEWDKPDPEIERWVKELINLRRGMSSQDAHARSAPSAREISPRQLIVDGPVTIYANLSDSPMPLPGTPVGVFGTILHLESQPHAAPDSVALCETPGASHVQ